MDKKTKKTLLIFAVICAAILLFSLIMALTGMDRSPGKSINIRNYDEQIRRILASEDNTYSGTKIIPYNVDKEQYVFDVEHNGKRLIPLKYVAQKDAECGAVLEYDFDKSTDYSTYKAPDGSLYKGFHQVLKLRLLSLSDGKELAGRNFRSNLPSQTTTGSYATFVQPFSDSEMDQIRDWIDEVMREYLNYED